MTDDIGQTTTREASEEIHLGSGRCVGCGAPNAEFHLVGCPVAIRAATREAQPKIVKCAACRGYGRGIMQRPGEVCCGCNGAGVHRV